MPPTPEVPVVPIVVPRPDARKAAVFVGVHGSGSGPGLLLVKRPFTAPTHAGEVAFPGGMREEADTDLAGTALRELAEEVGIGDDDVELLRPLADRSTWSSATIVTPWVGWIRTLDRLRVQESEIERVLVVPFEELLAGYHVELWRFAGRQREMHFFEAGGETVWGLTASMIFDLVDGLCR